MGMLSLCACGLLAQPGPADSSFAPAHDDAAPPGATLPLREALLRLQTHFGIDILFEETALDRQEVPRDAFDAKQSVEQNLTTLLHATGLQFRKIKHNTFLIKELPAGDTLLAPHRPLFGAPVPNEDTAADKEPTALSETYAISGRVTDVRGMPLPGVNVWEKGTTNGTVTNREGRCSLPVSEGAVLVFSAVGFRPQEVRVANRASVDIALRENVLALNEVVVVGYGAQRKEDVTGVVETVEVQSFNQGAIVTPDQLISGKVAGVQITQNSGEPGGQTSVRIRGGTSINASNEPLYVIDGVPIDNAPFNPRGFTAGRNPLNALNPADIESFTVLKDASATAIYGSRGANGVILITTKKGHAGEDVRVHYDGWVSAATLARGASVLNAEQFSHLIREQAPERAPFIGTAATDWSRAIYQTAWGQNHALSLTGGGKHSGYRASVGFMDQNGILKTSRTQRTSVSLGLREDLLNDQLRLDLHLKGAYAYDWFAPLTAIGHAARFNPTQPVYDADSPWSGFYEEANDLAPKNPVAELALTRDQGQQYRSIGNLQLDYQLPWLTGLSAKLNVGYDLQNGDRKRLLPTTLRSQYTTHGEIRVADVTRTNKVLDTYLTYRRAFEAFQSTVEMTGGYSYQDFRNVYPEYLGFDFSSTLQNELGFDNPRYVRQTEHVTTVLANRLIAFFGRMNYTWKDRYLMTVTVRRDGSSRFGRSHRWGTFPSAAVGWRVNNEPFLAQATWLSTLKLRLGWGVTGNQDIPDYRFLPTYMPGDGRTQVQFGDEFVSTLRPNGYDPNLKWEATRSVNLGLEYGFWQNRLSGAVELYHKKTDDLLFEVAVPAGANLSNLILTNIGTVENRGLEFSLNSKVVARQRATWEVGLVAAYNHNQVLRLAGSVDPDFQGYPTGLIFGGTGNTVQILREGEPVNAFFVFRHKLDANGNPLPDGVDHNGDGVLNPADLYQDLNGDGLVNEQDRAPFHAPAPQMLYGLTSGGTVGPFDWSVTLRAQTGNYVYNNGASYAALSRITTEITPTNLPTSYAATQFLVPQYFSDRFVERASFVRLDNLTVGCNPLSRSELVQLRVYATAQNLFVLTPYSGPDPEIGNISGKTEEMRYGIDDALYPRARTFLLGIHLSF